MSRKEILKRVKEVSKPIVDAALRSAATNVGNQLQNVTRNVNQPSDLHFGTLTNALKSGIMATGQEMMQMGMDRVKAIPSPDQKSDTSE